MNNLICLMVILLLNGGVCVCVCVCVLSCVQLSATLCEAPLSMGFSKQEYWSGVPLPSPVLTLELEKLRLGE